MITYRCPKCDRTTTTVLANAVVTHRCPADKHKDVRFVKEDEHAQVQS